MISPGNIIKQAVLVFSTFLALVPTLFMRQFNSEKPQGAGIR